MPYRSAPVSIFLLGLFASILHGGGEWPQFRGPTGQGISLATGVPVEWSATRNIAWRVEIPGSGWSSPVISEGKVYLTTAIGAQPGPVSLQVYCLDAVSGAILWHTEAFQPDPVAAWTMHAKNSPASGTPIVTSDRLYAHFGHLGTAALDLSGKVIWRQTGVAYPPVNGTGASPVLINGTLIFTCDGARDPFVAGLDANTGAVKWRTLRHTPAKMPFSSCTPLAIDVQGAVQAIIPGSGFVGGYDPADGRELWRVLYGEGYSVVPRPVFAHGMLFVNSGFDAATVLAIHPQGAKGDVTKTHVAWTAIKGGPRTPSMLVAGDELYYVSDAGIVTCADAMTGSVLWTQRLNGTFSASPVLAEGRIYFQSEAGVGFVMKAGKTARILAENDLEERSLASYAVTDHALFIRTQKRLWKVSSGK